MRRSAIMFALLLGLASCGRPAPQPEASASELTLHDPRRIVELEGGRNFRDLGGYRTFDGHKVRWGMLYRSGSPHHLTQADFARLDALGIRMVCDLRSTAERRDEPNGWAGSRSIPYWARNYDLDMTGVAAVLKDPAAGPSQLRNAMIADYRMMPEVQAEGFAAIFDALSKGQAPLALNCSAGKDRTGLASALILTALGVPFDTVIEDYALSDKIVDYKAELKRDAASNATAAWLGGKPWQVIEPLFRSDPAYLEAAFGAIRQRYGSVDVYLQQRLGVTREMRNRLRADLREKR